ncbi:sulfonate transport system permease protein [Rhodoblastus acidophilus]|uniref:ABC transporter permease n=1 Tax=Rhodoblastus acidophilus TaxID=1074 RepID=UPI0022259DEB|nr:ABC transporter permease [Rhodoblastus acidophilus]MCW2318777.1 sulfonate transport system permease protein [Rhodoblastus acidophilus]
MSFGWTLAPPAPVAGGTAIAAGLRQLRTFAASAGLALAVPLLLAALWIFCARYSWIPDQILPAPAAVWQTLREGCADGSLRDATLISLQRVLAGFGIGAGAGVLVGGLLGASRTLRSYIEPFFLAFNQVPHIAWMPVLMVLFGIGEALKIIIIAWAAFMPAALCALQGVRDVPEGFRELGRALMLDRRATFCTIVLPSALPSIFTGLREGLAHAWQALVAAELLASFEGLGYLMAYGRQLFQLDVVLAAMAIIALIGVAFHVLLRMAETRLRRWRLEGAQ